MASGRLHARGFYRGTTLTHLPKIALLTAPIALSTAIVAAQVAPGGNGTRLHRRRLCEDACSQCRLNFPAEEAPQSGPGRRSQSPRRDGDSSDGPSVLLRRSSSRAAAAIELRDGPGADLHVRLRQALARRRQQLGELPAHHRLSTRSHTSFTVSASTRSCGWWPGACHPARGSCWRCCWKRRGRSSRTRRS